jgi:molybdopterin-containing oxidoreductase family iron-sulfur binding subunit
MSFAAPAIGTESSHDDHGKVEDKGKSAKKSMELVVFPYPSVKSFDGRAANRPWLQELPDPITQVVWDSWGELHPETAKAIGVEQGDLLTVRNRSGEINVPVLVTPYVNKGIVAVPMGQGHTSYGRFAQVVNTGNVLELIGKPAQKGAPVALVSARAQAFKAPGRAKLVKTQGSDSQHDRDIGRTRLIREGASGALLTTGHKATEHTHEIKQMYQQREHPLYQWGMTIDLAACTGCSACVVACYAENNIPVVGKNRAYEGREMSWLRIERYYDNATFDNKSDLPAPEEQCHNAPCEPVCPVYATYHNEEGMNAMVYNRCVGTRYCSNNCSYKVRRFNWYDYEFPDTLQWQLNPDVTKRTVGVMEKCTFCVQRIAEAKDNAKDQGRAVRDGEVQPACVQSCPTQALTFGNMKDPQSAVNKARDTDRAYKVLDYYINTQPAVSYLERLRYAKT